MKAKAQDKGDMNKSASNGVPELLNFGMFILKNINKEDATT